MFTSAIVCPPSQNFAQGLTTSELRKPDYKIAQVQHQAYCQALENCGLTVTRLSADDVHPDSAFVEDTAVLIEPADEPKKFHAVITRPGALSRRDETIKIREALRAFFPSIQEIQAPGTVDGGDVCQAGKHFFIGVSERTNEDGAQELAQRVRELGYSATLIDMRNEAGLLHLKSGLAWLGDDCLAVVETIAERTEFSRYDLLRVPADEAYAANCIRVNDRVLIAAGHPEFASVLAARGYQTVALDMSEFQKMDGGLSCLSLRF